MSIVPYAYPATVRRVIDGDSLRADLDLGFGFTWRGDNGQGVSLRLAGCNARELSEPGGQEARLNLIRMMERSGWLVLVRSVRTDKYGGRYGAEIELGDGRDLVDVLVVEEWAARWSGDGPRPLPPWPRTVP